MSLFEFLMVLVSLIIGLGISEFLAGVARISRNKDSVQPYWVHSTLIVIVFLALSGYAAFPRITASQRRTV